MSVPHPCFLLVDDHALFRTGLALMLAQAWPHARVVQVASWGEALRALQREQPDLVMLDVHLPDGHGLADLAALKAHVPSCPVLLMSAEVDAAGVQRARDAGALGFLPKSASAADVMAAVRAALVGQSAFAAVPYAALAPQAGRDAASQTGANPAAFVASEHGPGPTDSQLSILRYLGRGTPNKAIARHLGMTEADVRAEVSWLTERLGANSREEAYASAVARGWVQP